MDNTKQPRTDTSSLLDLKAELYRKQESFKQAKLKRDAVLMNSSPLKCKKANIHKKPKSDINEDLKNESDEEEALIKKSRSALEAKAKLYEKIVNQNVIISDEENQNYEVDFQRKVINRIKENAAIETESTERENTEVNNKKSEWSEELHQTQQKEINLVRDYTPTLQGKHDKSSSAIKQCPSSLKDAKEKGLQKSEHDFNTEFPLHYQNVQFNEVRDHGVGYYGFSTDEERRKQQMDMLKDLREQTELQKAAREKVQQKKSALLKDRLAKVCQRRNIDESVIDKYTVKKDTEEVDLAIEKQQTSFKIENENKNLTPAETDSLSKPKKIRPWDVGKSLEGDQNPTYPKPKDTLSHGQWLENRRNERVEEFAPPALYFE